MAVSGSNAMVKNRNVRISLEQAFNTADSEQRATLGDMATTPDGRLWQYVQATEDLEYGNILSNPQSIVWYETTEDVTVDITDSAFFVAPAAGWTTDPSDIIMSRFLIVTGVTVVGNAALVGYGGYVTAYSVAGGIRIHKTIPWVANETSCDIAVYNMALHEVEKCDCGSPAVCPIVVGACQVDGGVSEDECFWMYIGPRGTFAHIWVADGSGVTEGDCLKCSGTDGKAEPVEEADAITDPWPLANVTFAEAVHSGSISGAELILSKWLHRG
jgi:hypothetical protein